MEVANLDVTEREARGRRKMRVLRGEGKIPAVIYGRDRENIHLSVPGHEFTKLIQTHHKLFQLHYPGGRTVEAFVQDLQWDPIEDSILHADFMRIDLAQKMHTVVDINFVGQPKGLSKNGVFDVTHGEIRVECLPTDLPESIRIVVNDLDVGDAVHIRDLTLPDGVVALDDPGLLLAQCKLRHVNLAEDEEEEAAEEGAAEPEVIGKDKAEDKDEA